MKKLTMLISVFALLISASSIIITGCASDADVASENLSKAAEQFEIARRIVFFNGITDTYLLSVEGLCSVDENMGGTQLAVTCKIGDNKYVKHYLGLSDNVSYFSEQLDGVNVSTQQYRVIFKPSTILPNIDTE